jgi:hypothetical protein
MLPFPVLGVEGIEERVLIHQLAHLLLREAEGLFEEVSGFTRKMNHVFRFSRT